MEVDVESKGRVVFNFGLLLFGFKAATALTQAPPKHNSLQNLFILKMSPSRAMDVEEPLEDLEAGERDPLHRQEPSQPVCVLLEGRSTNTKLELSDIVACFALDVIQAHTLPLCNDTSRNHSRHCQSLRTFTNIYFPVPRHGCSLDHDGRPQSLGGLSGTLLLHPGARHQYHDDR